MWMNSNLLMELEAVHGTSWFITQNEI